MVVWTLCSTCCGNKVTVGLLKSPAQLWDEQIQTPRKRNPEFQTLADPGAASEGGMGIRIAAFRRGRKGTYKAENGGTLTELTSAECQA